MSLEIVLLINALLFVGAYIQGIVGFGIGIFCASIFAVFVPQMVPGPMILLSIILATIMLFRGRHDVNVHFIKWPILGSILGILCAGWIVSLVSKAQFDIIFGVLLLFLVGISFHNYHFTGKVASITAGYLSGLMGTITAIGGPPMGLLMKESEPSIIRANLAFFFLTSSIIAIITLIIINALGRQEFYLATISAPGMLIGYALSQKVKLFQKQEVVSKAILFVSLFCAVYVVIRGLSALL